MIHFMNTNYYTYAYLRLDGTPYYIGRGCGRRAFKNHRHIAVPPKERILFLKKNLTYLESIKHEIYMIFILGRKDLGTGILRNLTNGGEGTKGYKVTEQTCSKIRQTLETTHATRGSFWWKNLEENLETQSHECPGLGWELGRLPYSESHREKLGRKGEKHGRTKLTDDDRRQIALKYVPGKKNGTNGNGSELAKRFGVCQGQIRRIAMDPRWTS